MELYKDNFFPIIKMTIDAMSDIVFLMEVCDDTFCYVLINSAAKTKAHFSKNIYGKRIEEVLPEDSANFIKTKYKEAIQQNKQIVFELEYFEDGELRVGETSVGLMELDGRKLIMATVRDVTARVQRERKLKEIKEEMELLWNCTSNAMFTIAQDGSILTANPAFESMLGWTMDDLMDKVVPPFFSNISKTRQDNHLKMFREGKSLDQLETQRIRKDGEVIDVLASYRPINQGNTLAIGTYRDITERKRTEEMLKASEERYRTLVELSPEPVIVYQNERVIYINPAGVDVIGAINESEVIGRTIWSFIHPDFMSYVKKRLDYLLKANPTEEYKGKYVVEKFIRLDGKEIVAEVAAVPIEYHGKPAIQAMFRDITSRKHYEEQLEFMAYHDPLTELMNRRMFTDIIDRSIEDATQNQHSLAVIYLDMDKFKEVNDTYGHGIGDELLHVFAKRLKNVIKESDAICRVGGDEFIILIKEVENIEVLVEIAKRILFSMQKRFKINEYMIRVSTSLGIARYPEDGNESKTLIRNADQALYKAKEEGNGYFFYKEINRKNYENPF